MKPLIILISVFIISIAVIYFMYAKADIELSGRIAMAVMLVFTSIGHFKFTKGMVMMMPSFIPAKKFFVIATGFIEILAATGLLVPSTIRVTGWLLVAFFILILPANIFAAIKHVDFEKADYSEKGTSYLWFRIPLQIFFIGWIYFLMLKD